MGRFETFVQVSAIASVIRSRLVMFHGHVYCWCDCVCVRIAWHEYVYEILFPVYREVTKSTGM